MNEFQIYDFEKRTWNTVSLEVWKSYDGYKRNKSGGFCHEYNKPQEKYRHFYTVETVSEPRRVLEEFDEYKQAYAALCGEYIREMNEGCEITLYQVLSHSVTYWGDTGYVKNSMTQPTWK